MNQQPFIFMGGGARPDEAAACVGGPTVLSEMLEAGLLVPVTKSNRLTVYDRTDLHAA